MITLPTQFQNGWNAGTIADSAVIYFIDINLLNAGEVNHLYVTNQPGVSFTYGGSSVVAQSSYLAATIINSGQEQTVDGIGEIDLSFDPTQGGAIASTNTISLTLLNQGNFVTTHSYDFENQPVKIYKTFASTGDSLTVETDMAKVFDGVITQAYTYDNTQFRIDCVDRRQVDTRYIPQHNINTNVYPYADPAAINKFIPIVFGDFGVLNHQLFTVNGVGLSSYQMGMIFAVPTIVTNAYQNYAYASDVPYSVTGQIFVTDDSSKYITALSAEQYTVSSDSHGLTAINVNQSCGELWITPSAQGYHLDILPAQRSALIMGEEANLAQMDIGGAVDRDVDTYSSISGDGSGNPGGGNSLLQVQLPSFNEPGEMINKNDTLHAYSASIDFYFGGLFTYDNAGPTDGFGMEVMDSQDPVNKHNSYAVNAGSDDGTFIQEWAVQASDINTDMADMTWALMKRLYFAIYGPGSGTVAKHLWIRQLWVRARTRFENTGLIKAVVDVPQFANVTILNPANQNRITGKVGPIFVTRVQQVGSTQEIRGQGISNLFVPAFGPHYTADLAEDSIYTTADIVTNPVKVIEYLLRYKCGVPSANIDSTSFNLVAENRVYWTLAASLIERKSVFDYINDICREFHLSLVLTNGGKYKIVAHDTGASVYTITTSDIYFDGFPQIFVETTSNDQIYNDIVLQYQYDYTASKTTKSTYVSDVDYSGTITTNLSDETGALRDTNYTDWMDESKTKYGNTVRQLPITSQLIQDQTTAELSLKKFCDWLAFKRLIVTMKLVHNLNTMALEIGDQVKISNPLLTSGFSNNALFLITSITYPAVNTASEPYITMVCLEMPSANTGIPVYTNRFISSEDLAAQ